LILGKSATETLAMSRQAFREESTVLTRKPKLTETKKGETGEEQSQEHAHHFSNKGLVHDEFTLEGQTVNSAYYCDILQ
jgi:hypothetical protein